MYLCAICLLVHTCMYLRAICLLVHTCMYLRGRWYVSSHRLFLFLKQMFFLKHIQIHNCIVYTAWIGTAAEHEGQRKSSVPCITLCALTGTSPGVFWMDFIICKWLERLVSIGIRPWWTDRHTLPNFSSKNWNPQLPQPAKKIMMRRYGCFLVWYGNHSVC